MSFGPSNPDEFQLIADSAPVPMWVTKLDRKRSFVNRAYVDFVGVSYEAAIDFDWRTIIHPDDAARTLAASVAGEASLETFTLEARYRRADGEWRWLRSVSQPRWDEVGAHAGFIGVAYDITEMRLSEQAAREREAQISAFINQTAAGVAQVDLTGRFTLVNDRFCQITGRTADELSELTMQEITHPDDLPRNVPLFERAVADGTPYTHEKRYVRPDGTIVWVNNSVAVIRRPDGTPYGVLAVTLDVTERREADATLRRSEESVRLAVQGAGMATVVVDLDTMSGPWSPNRFALFGLPCPDDQIGSFAQWLERVHPDDRQRFAEAVEDCFQNGIAFQLEYRIERADDSECRWLQSHGTLIEGVDDNAGRFVGVSFDITARKEAQQALAALNDTLESEVATRTAERDGMWRLSQDLFLVVTPRWVIRAVNPAVNAFGYLADEVVGRRFSEFVHPDDLQDAIAILRGAARQPIGGLLARLRTKNGDWRLMSWSAVPGTAEAYVIGRDITVEAQRRGELEAAQDALRQAQKVESLGQLTGGVAHDFNNLLTPIIGNLDLLRRRTDPDKDRELRLIGSALEAAERARLLVQRLLAFARRQPLTIGAVDVAALIEGMTGLIASTSGPQIDLQLKVAPDLSPARADVNQLEMAILNLSVNARDAMPNGGKLVISADAETVLTDNPRQLAPGPYIRLQVADTGAGMDQATLARAIEPFFSTKETGKGTGLGLSMVHGLAAQLGGDVYITSEVDVGTTVDLLIPAMSGPVIDAQLVRSNGAAPQTGRVLVVDDDAQVRMVTADMLAELGYSVEQSSDGDDALSRLAREPFDLLVTDHMMPGMTGAQLAAQVRQSHPRVRTLVVSGYSELDQIPAHFARLQKPFRLEDLQDELERIA